LTATFSLLAHPAWDPPTSSSLVEEKRLHSLLLSTAVRDFQRSQRLNPSAAGQPRNKEEADERTGHEQPGGDDPRQVQAGEKSAGVGWFARDRAVDGDPDSSARLASSVVDQKPSLRDRMVWRRSRQRQLPA
jgi:hypothetical protein